MAVFPFVFKLVIANINYMKVISISNHSPSTKEVKGLTKISSQFAGWRRASKTVNFATLFGATAPTMAKQLENAGYKEAEAEEYIELTNNTVRYNEKLIQMRGKMAPQKVKFLVAAELMLEAYYNGFPGVKERALREKLFAWKNGYSRMWHGPVKHLPELKYMARNA